MAWAIDPIWTWNLKFVDSAGRSAKMGAGIRVVDAVTEATARAKVLAIASAAQTISATAVQSTVLRVQSDNVAENVPIEVPGNPYRTIEDRIRLRLGDGGGDKRTPILLPAPKANVVDSTGEVADSSNAALQSLLSFLADCAVSYGKKKLLEYIDGTRERSKTIVLPPGHGYQIAP